MPDRKHLADAGRAVAEADVAVAAAGVAELLKTTMLLRFDKYFCRATR
jgi:hypothetical protein